MSPLAPHRGHCMYWRVDSEDTPSFLRGSAAEGTVRVTCDMDGRFWAVADKEEVPKDCPEAYGCRYHVLRS